MKQKHIVLIGGTGLIGNHLRSFLLEKENIEITSLVRTIKSEFTHPTYKEVVFHFDNTDDYKKIGNEIPCDILFCCLGTTIKKAKNAENFLKVDRDYPIQFIEQLKKTSPQSLFVFVSSVGANSPKGLYLKAKSNVENSLIQSKLHYIIARPSILLGERSEFRITEKIAGAVVNPLFKGMRKLKISNLCGIDKYAPIEAKQVAKAMLNCAFNFTQDKILEGKDFLERAECRVSN